MYLDYLFDKLVFFFVQTIYKFDLSTDNPFCRPIIVLSLCLNDDKRGLLN